MNQLILFNPAHEVVEYIGQNATLELTYDGQLKTIWMTQKQMAELYKVQVPAINKQIRKYKVERGETSDISKEETTASDGKTYLVEKYNLSVIQWVGYHVQATAEAINLQKFFEALVEDRLRQEYARQMRQRNVAITAYQLSGKTKEWAESRIETKDQFKALTALVFKVCDKPNIGKVINTEYLALFGEVADTLKALLSAKNLRDALPDLQLDYLKLAEKNLCLVLTRKESLTSAQLLQIVEVVCVPLGEQLETICKMLGIDRATGKPLLEGAK